MLEHDWLEQFSVPPKPNKVVRPGHLHKTKAKVALGDTHRQESILTFSLDRAVASRGFTLDMLKVVLEV